MGSCIAPRFMPAVSRTRIGYSRSYLAHISLTSRLYLAHISRVSPPDRLYMSRIPPAFLSISHESQEYLTDISRISFAYFAHFSRIYRAYLFHLSRMAPAGAVNVISSPSTCATVRRDVACRPFEILSCDYCLYWQTLLCALSDPTVCIVL